MATGRFTFADMQNPLFLHPSDGPLSVSVSKLQGATDYQTWKRSMEIQLSSKRKLGFVKGTVLRATDDETNGVQWDTCNNMIISWIHNNVSDSICSSILFVESADEIRNQIERIFMLTNGSRKYMLNKDLFDLKQNRMKIAESFTSLSSTWDELELLNVLPPITNVTAEITTFLTAIEKYKEEAKLFQFLNGLDEVYIPQRSQLLLMTPLPLVQIACAAIQQEESQREGLVLNSTSVTEFDNDAAMYSKGNMQKSLECVVCHGKGHTKEGCWTIIGYPKWHKLYQGPQSNSKGSVSNSHKWTNQKNNNVRMSNSAELI